MAERSSINQVIQIGVEATPGTAVTGSKRLQSIGITPTPAITMDTFRPAGQKYAALSTLSKEWVTASIAGKGSFTELVYLLSSVMTTPVITTPATGVLARQWVFSPSTTADDAPKTFTVEHGSSVRADRFNYGIVNDLSMSFSRDAVDVGGSMMGRALTDNIVLTPAPTFIPLQPILPTQLSVYLDTTFATLGTTKLTRLLSASFNLGGRFGPLWVVDAANPSWVTHVETVPDLHCNILVEADTQGMGLLNTLRTGDTAFLRIEAVGPIIETTIAYKFTLDIAVKVSGTSGFSDNNGVYAVEWNLLGINDGGWGKALQCTLINTLTAL